MQRHPPSNSRRLDLSLRAGSRQSHSASIRPQCVVAVQVVCGCRLRASHVVAHDAGAAAVCCHRATIGIGQRDLLIGRLPSLPISSFMTISLSDCADPTERFQICSMMVARDERSQHGRAGRAKSAKSGRLGKKRAPGTGVACAQPRRWATNQLGVELR